MNHTALTTSENKDAPILIVDKKGDLGNALAKRLKNESLVVLVSQTCDILDENIIHIPFLKKIPSIPDNTYSYIFLIDESSDINESLIKPFLKKAEKDNAVLLLCINKRFISDKVINNFLSSFTKAKVAILGDIFSKDRIYPSKNQVNDFIHEIKTNKRITVPGDGTREVFPVLFEDAIDSILEAVFGDHDKEKVFLIFSNQAVSLLKIASIFKKIIPGITLDFIKEKQKNKYLLINIEGKHLISENYNIEEKIKKINLESPELLKNSTYENDKKIKNWKTIDYFLFFLSFAFSILIVPIILTIGFSLIGASMLYAIKQEASFQNIMLIKPQAQIAFYGFSFAKESISLLEKEMSFVGREDLVLGFSQNILQGKELSGLILSSSLSYEKALNIINNKSPNPKTDFSFIYSESKKDYYTYQKLFQDGLIPQVFLAKISSSLKIYSSIVDFWPDLLGFNGQKTYMVLFQNNMELRPGGGFIGSYAVFNLNQGKILDFKIYDVYDADGQLKTHFEPPFAIRRYLLSVNWYLRDSNFNVDYSKGSVAGAIFLNSEMHQNPDGVIAIDLSFVKSLLSVLGPVNVSDYKEIITSDNFFQVTEKHAQKDFFPGSTQKKDFLKSFYSSFILKLSENKNIQYLSLINVLANSIYEKHILFSFNNQALQTAFSLNGYSSALVDNRKQDSNIINDFIGVNEANLGADKVNYFISRNLSQSVTIAEDGSIKGKALIVIKNSADEKAWLGGGYKSYIRIILPLEASLSSIKIDDINQQIVDAIKDPTVYEKKGFTPPAGLEVEKYNQEKNTIYGFLINIRPKQLKTISLEYKLLQKVNIQNPEIKYSLKVFKQPGVDFLPYEFSISFPKNLKAIDYSKDIKINTNQASLSTQVKKDEEFTISFGQK